MHQSRSLRVPWGAALALALVSPLVAAGAQGEEEPGNPLDEHTALMAGGNRWKLGVFEVGYGITDALSVGIDPPAWALWAIKPAFVPNLHLKKRFWRNPEVSAQIGAYYARVSRDGIDGHLLLVPVSVFVSREMRPGWWAHLEANYNWIRGFGSGDPSRVEIRGGLATRSGQLGAMVEHRLSRVVALLVRGRYQLLTTPLVLEGSGLLDPYTRADFGLEAHPRYEHPWMAVGGVALTWRYVGLVLGAGYGHYFAPGANVAFGARGFVPDASLWVRL
jgi:hypothetical protein